MSEFENNPQVSEDELNEALLEEAEAVEVCIDYEAEEEDDRVSSSDEEMVSPSAPSDDAHAVPHHGDDLPRAHVSTVPHHVVHRKKTIYFIRHGVTEANELCGVYPWDSDFFRRSADLWDTRLCENGKRHAVSINRYYYEKHVLRRERPALPTPVPSHRVQHSHAHPPVDIDFSSVEVILASPLTRALQTSELLFYYRNGDEDKRVVAMDDDEHGPREPLLGPHVKKIAHPLMREMFYHVSEAGRSKAELEREFPSWDFSALPEDDKPWWYTETRVHAVEGPDGEIRHIERTYPHKEPLEPYEDRNAYFEPWNIFSDRMRKLEEYLLSRPEKVMIVVSHSEVMSSLLGGNYHNCHIERMHY